ncbi:MAG: PAS domain-containing protein [Methylococcaceae bacterium]
MDKKPTGLNTLRIEEAAEQSDAPTTKPVIRSANQLLHDLRYQLEMNLLELDMQHEKLRCAHAALEESQARYVDLYENVPTGYFLLTHEGLISEVNRTALQLINMERRNLLHQHFAALVSPQDGDRWHLFFSDIIKHKRQQTIELSLKNCSNSERPVLLNCLCLNSSLRITVTDNTKNRQATADLCEARALVLMCAEHQQQEKSPEATLHRLQKISSSVPGVIYQYRLRSDGSSCFPYASAAMYDIYRVSPEDVLNDAAKVFAILHPEDYDGIVASIQASAMNLTPWNHEYRVKFDDGTIYWLLGNALPEREIDGSTLWHGFITNITARKQMENELRETRFIWKFALEGSGDGIWDWNIQTGHVNYSKEFTSMLGYGEDNPPFTYQDWQNNLYPADLPSVTEALRAYLEGKTKSYNVEYRLRCKDGNYKWIMARGAVVNYGEDSSPLRMIGTHTDISQRKIQEQQYREHLDQLAHISRLGLMGEMASGISHEVNQPLSAISSYTQVSLNIINTENPDLVKLTEILVKTQQQALRAGTIIHRMKHFCKPNSQRRLTVDMNKLINNCVTLCSDELKLNNVTLLLELENNLPSIHIDELQIEQVLINLCRNSIDALHSSPKKYPSQITIQSRLMFNDAIRISVKDNGLGIAIDQQKQVLTPFYTTKTSGMGMGLSISNALIEAHQGALRFNSEPGKGSTFYFTLPLARAALIT